MAQVSKNVQNNFIAGLKTEYTALNFPENAATDCSNIDFSLIGDISRRGGIDYEANATVDGTVGVSNSAVNTYKWNNVGGDGSTQIVVLQSGNAIVFYRSSAATITNPLSGQKLSTLINPSTFVASGGSFDTTQECQFADGNGYLFVFHPSCDPFYCTYNSATNTISASVITIQIRDFAGIPDGLPVNNRPLSLSAEHQYNLFNQGWSSTPVWSATSSTTNTAPTTVPTVLTFTIQSGLAIQVGDIAQVTQTGFIGFGITPILMAGNVTSYSGTTLVINITSVAQNAGRQASSWSITKSNQGLINTWHTAEGNYPSNSDVWWLYKNNSGVFDPLNTQPYVSASQGQAPQGHFIFGAFNQNRSVVSGIAGLTTTSTVGRPRTGAWFQGRVWYSGVDASFNATGDAPYATWTENIYFSQIIQQAQDFGTCYQTNDPTAENFFDLLPSDGGVIVIQGSGSIYKLFPVQNGLLVFAANGIWFITGNAGLGFTANDYTVVKISGVQSISGTSFVNVLGWPIFWNLEGIYEVAPGNQSPEGQRVMSSGIQVENLTVGNILSFYQNIPETSKLYARGDYDPINYQVQWLYRSTQESGITNRYQYDSILVHNTIVLPRVGNTQLGKPFYPYKINTTLGPLVYGLRFVQNPSASTTTPPPLFKYLVNSNVGTTWAEENNFTSYTDWLTFNGVGVDAAAFVKTGYNLKPQHHPYYGYYAQALVKHGVSYLNVFIRNTSNNSFLFNSIWDWASSSDTGKFSSQQQVTNNLTSNKFQYLTRRLRVRGRGFALQLQFQSVPGQAMDIVGWSMFESIQEAP